MFDQQVCIVGQVQFGCMGNVFECFLVLYVGYVLYQLLGIIYVVGVEECLCYQDCVEGQQQVVYVLQFVYFVQCYWCVFVDEYVLGVVDCQVVCMQQVEDQELQVGVVLDVCQVYCLYCGQYDY